MSLKIQLEFLAKKLRNANYPKFHKKHENSNSGILEADLTSVGTFSKNLSVDSFIHNSVHVPRVADAGGSCSSTEL